MSRLIYSILGLTLLICLQVKGQSSRNEEQGRQFNAQMERGHRKIQGVNTLNYGESCSHDTEQSRIRLNKKIYDAKAMITDPTVDIHELHSTALRIQEELANLPGQFCNAYKALTCNSTGQCFCGAGHMYLNYNLKYDSRLENGKCVLAHGSICAPDNILNENTLFNLPKTEHRCSSSFPCEIKSNGKRCETEAMKQEFRRLAGKLNRDISESDYIEFIFKKYIDGVCICKGSGLVISQNVLLLGLGTWIISRILDL